MATPSTLTRAQLQALRRKLEDERARLRRVLGASEPAAPAAEERAEPEEVAQRAAEGADLLEVAERERRLLAEVERALARMDAGTYGVSEATGEPIPYQRLASVPWARGEAEEEGG